MTAGAPSARPLPARTHADRWSLGPGLVGPGLVGPSIEESTFGRFDIVADDDAHVPPAAACQPEAAQCRRLEADEKRKEGAGDDRDRRRGADQTQGDRKRDGKDDVADQCQPQPMPQHPPRRQQEGPEREAVAHEDEALGIGRGFVRFQRRLVHGVDRHGVLLSPWRQRVSRRASPWSKEPRWPRADRSRPQRATRVPSL